MWIAYKIYYLCDRKQLRTRLSTINRSCELLTKFIIFAIGNNHLFGKGFDCDVVNCLQNLLSLRSETTVPTCYVGSGSCELLTKFIIFAIGNNFARWIQAQIHVVNCLQNLLSLRSETTKLALRTTIGLLWIAYKIYYLCDRKQQIMGANRRNICCELLTKFIIFAIGNNRFFKPRYKVGVVNCLQNLLSLRSETTLSIR